MDIRWSILKSDWLYFLQPKVEKLYTVSKTRPGAECGSYHQLLIAKFRLKLNKVVKTKRERERYTQLNPEFQRIARRDKKAFLNEQCKEIEGNGTMGKTRSLQEN